MIQLTSENTKGKIATYLKSYEELDFSYGGYEDYCNWFVEFYKKYDNPRLIMAVDIETKKLYPKDNKFLMFAVTYKIEVNIFQNLLIVEIGVRNKY